MGVVKNGKAMHGAYAAPDGHRAVDAVQRFSSASEVLIVLAVVQNAPGSCRSRKQSVSGENGSFSR